MNEKDKHWSSWQLKPFDDDFVVFSNTVHKCDRETDRIAEVGFYVIVTTLLVVGYARITHN